MLKLLIDNSFDINKTYMQLIETKNTELYLYFMEHESTTVKQLIDFHNRFSKPV